MYCKADPSSVVRLYPHLIPKFADELDTIFTAYIKWKATHAGNRHGYKEACGIISHYLKACGKAKAKIIISELLDAYSHRPAFIDELNSITIR